jgi:hypothetical protein
MLDPLAVEGIEPRTLGWIGGLVLLLFGRRLYWLFSGIVGFFVGLYLAYQLLPSGPEWLALLGGLLVGACGALVAVFFQKVALAVAGFLAGAYSVFWLSGEMGWALGALQWLVALAAGVVGALLVRALFEIGLVLLSSLLGAALLVQASGWHGGQAGVLFLLLVGAGVLVQAAFTRRRAKKKS